MSDLMPNLDDLLAKLSPDAPGGVDALALAQACVSAKTWEEVDEALTGLLAAWAQP